MTVGHVSSRLIYSRDGLAPGASESRNWNKPPEGTTVAYWANARPPRASGAHGSTRGSIEITNISHTYVRDNYNGDTWVSTITVKNIGDQVTGYDVYQSWVDLA